MDVLKEKADAYRGLAATAELGAARDYCLALADRCEADLITIEAKREEAARPDLGSPAD